MENNLYAKRTSKNAFFRWLLFLSCSVLVLGFSGQVKAQSTLINPSGDGGFESAATIAGNGWTLVSGLNGNFFPGTATVSNGSYSFSPTGSRMIYFSNNSGVSWRYNTSPVSGATHMYRDVTFPSGNPTHALSFRYNVGPGESTFDEMYVYLCPTTLTPAANSPSTSSTTPTWTGTGTATLLGTFRNLAAGSGTTGSINITSAQAGNASAANTMRLVFTWKNDGGSGFEPPVALDDISLVSFPCTPVTQPTALVLTSPALGSISGSFTAAVGGNITNYLVVRYPRLAASTPPVNGTTYTVGQSLGLGTVIGVNSSSTLTFSTSGLPNATQYDIYVYSYNSTAGCSPTPVYRTNNPLVGTVTTATPSLPTCPGNVTTTITGTSGSSTITVGSNTGISVGMAVTGTGIATGATVSSVSGTTVTLSAANTAAVSGTGTFGIFPANGATGLPLAVTLGWGGATGTPAILGYSVYLSTNISDVTNLSLSARVANGQSGTTYSATNLALSTTYYWKIVPISSFGSNTSCSVNSFTTRTPAGITSTALGGIWNDVNTWVGGVVPLTGDNVTIADGAVVTINSATNLNSINSLTIGSGGTGRTVLEWAGTLSVPLTVFNDITIGSNGVFNPYNNSLAGQTINVGGNFTNNGIANLAMSGTTLVFNGSQAPGGNAVNQDFGGTGVYLGYNRSGVNSGLLPTLTIATTGNVSINPTGSTGSFTLTAGLNVNAGTLSTNSKLIVDNTALGFNQSYNNQVVTVKYTTQGTAYTAAPVVFGSSVTPWPAAGQTLSTLTTTRYFFGDNVYQVSTGNSALLSTGVGPTFTTPSIQAAPSQSGTYNVFYLGKLGTIGTPYTLGGGSLTAGTVYFLGDNLYLCTSAGTSNNSNIPTCNTAGSTCSAGSATFRYIGSPAKVSVNYDATTNTVRGFQLVSGGSGYLPQNTAPSIIVSPSNATTPTTAAVATAYFIQSIQGSTSFAAQRSTQAIINGGLTINSTAGAGSFTGVGNSSFPNFGIYTTNGGYGYTVAPSLGFPLPTNSINFVTSGGSGYTSLPTVSVSGGNPTTPATFTPVIAQGRVVGVYCTSGGTGYNYANAVATPITLTISGGGGSGATAAVNAAIVPGATGIIDPNNQSICGFTITNPGSGYTSAPTPNITTAGTSLLAMTTPTCRAALYNLTYGFFSPSTTNTFPATGPEIPSNRKINTLTVGNNTATGFAKVSLSGNLEVFASSSALSLSTSTVTSSSQINLNGNTLTFSHPQYNGLTGSSFGHAYDGSITLNHLATTNTTTKNFPFEGTFSVITGSTNTVDYANTGATMTSLTATVTGAPSGTVNNGSGSAIGSRGYQLAIAPSGSVFGNQPQVTMNWTTNDNFSTSITPSSVFIGQSTSLTGGVNGWTSRSIGATSGTIPGTGSRSTTQTPPAIDLNNGSFFAWLSTSSSSITATGTGGAWSDPATWVGNIVPSLNDDAVIPSGSTVYVDAALSVKNISISGSLLWGSSSAALTVVNDIVVNSGGRFLAYTSTSTGQTINLGGHLTNNGTMNLAVGSTVLNMNGSQQTGGRSSQIISGTGTFIGSSSTVGIIRQLNVATTGSVTIDAGTTQSLVTGQLNHTSGTFTTNGKLTIDNTANVWNQTFNRGVASVNVTNMGSLYNAAPVVFGATVVQYVNGNTATAGTYYYNSANNQVYLCTVGGTFNATAPTSTGGTAFTTSGPTLFYVGNLGTLGTPMGTTSASLGGYFMYNGGIYICVGAGVPSYSTTVAISLSPTQGTTYTVGAATFRYLGTAPTVTVNYSSTTRNVRSLNLTSAGNAFVANAPTLSVTFSNPSTVAAPVTAATASAVVFQSIVGNTNSAMQRSSAATISGGLSITSSHTVGSALFTNGGHFTAVPTIAFSGPTNVNLVTNGGSGYTAAPTITVTGSTVSGTALTSSNFTITVANGKVVSVYLNTATTATYTTPPTLTMSAPGGSGTTATLAWPPNSWATGTATLSNGTNGGIVGITITNAGSGYIAAPTVGVSGGASSLVAAASGTAVVGLYNLSYVAPTPTATVTAMTEGAEIPSNRRLNQLTMNSSAGVTFTGNLELMAGTSALSLTSGRVNLGSNTLTFSHRTYGGPTVAISTTNFVSGKIIMNSPGGSQTRNFPFSAPVSVATGTGSNATGSDITTLTVDEFTGSAGATAASGNFGVTGKRAYRVQRNAGSVFGTSPTVSLRFNALDSLTGNQAEHFIGQSSALTGPSWTIRSSSYGTTGTMPASGTLTTSTATTTANGSSGSPTITVTSAAGISVGMSVSGTGIAPGATVSSISGTTVTLSANNTAALSATSVSFGVGYNEFFTWLKPSPQITNVTVPAGGRCAPTLQTITADVIVPSPLLLALPTAAGATNPSLSYQFNGGTAVSVPMTLVSGNTYTANIPAPPDASTNVTWSITAVDSIAGGSTFATTFTGTPYTDIALLNTVVNMTATPPSFCGNGGQVVLNASVTPADPSVTYSWTGDVATAPTTGPTVTANISSTSAFRVTATKGGCTATGSVSVGVYPFPSAAATATPSAVCLGSTATLASGLSASNFSANCIVYSPIPIPDSSTVTNFTTLVRNGVQVGPRAPITTHGTVTGDGGWNNIPIGFSFNFFGVNRTVVGLTSKGVLYMNNDNAEPTQYNFPGGFPNTSNPANVIAILAADYQPGRNNGPTAGTIRCWTQGVAPNRIFVVDFENIAGWSAGASSFQGILYETTGNVEIHVLSANASSTFSTPQAVKYIGLQESTRTIGATAPNCATGVSNYWNGITDIISSAAPFAWRFVPPNPYNVVFTPSSQISGSSSGTNLFTATAAPTNAGTTVYTITYTNLVTGCSNNSNPVLLSVTTASNPVVPVVTSPVNICGAQTITLSINNAATLNATDIVRWFDSPTSNFPIGTGSSFTTFVNASKTYYVTVGNTTCQSTRVPLVVNLTSPTQITVPNATLCASDVIPLSVSSTLSAYDTYLWSPYTDLYQDANATVQYAGQSLSTVYVRPSTQGQITYTINGYDFASSCSNQANAVVTVQPTGGIINASTTNICYGGASSATLTLATSTPVAPNTVLWEVSGDNISWAPVSGNTSTTLNTGALTQTTYYRASVVDDYSSACFTTPAFTVNVTAPPTGNASQTFCAISNPTVASLSVTGFAPKWYAAASGGTALASSTPLTNGTTYYASQTANGCESVLRFAVTVTIGTIPAPTGSASQSFCISSAPTVSNLTATGSNIQWYAANTGGSPLSSSTALVGGSTYYASQTVGGCESSARLAVSVTFVSVTAAPTGSASQSFCISTTPNPTIADLVVTGTSPKWYDAPTGGNLLPSSTPLVNGTSYYASQTLGLCGESTDRLEVSVTINDTPAPTGTGSQSFCASAGARVSDLSVTADPGGTITWWTLPVGGSQITSNPLLTSQNYYAAQTIGGCRSALRFSVSVSIISTPAPTATSPQTFCSTANATVADLTATGTGIQWYAASSGGSPLASTVSLTNGTTYYASQFDNGCESTTRRAVVVSISAPLGAPSGAATQSFCSASSPTVANLSPSGANILWYDVSSGGTPLASSTALVDGLQYYASQSNSICGESTDRLNVTVTLLASPAAPSGDATQSFCASSNPRISDLVVTGSSGAIIKWYSTATGGGSLASTTALVNNNTYYASQTVNGCESDSRFAVTVSVGTLSTPTGSASQSFCGSANPTLADIVVNETVAWFASSTGGSPLASTTALVNGTTYYAAQASAGCFSTGRLAVTVTVTADAPPTGAATQSFCASSNPTISSLSPSGASITWYDAQSGGNILPVSNSLLNGTTYYAEQSLGACGVSSTRLAVAVTVVATPSAPSGSASQTFCARNNPKVSDLSPSGASIKWYSAPSGGTLYTGATALLNGNTYYASQTVSGCESSDRLEVTVVIDNPAAPTGSTTQTFCGTTPTIADLVVTATGTVTWYSSSSSNTPLSSSLTLTNGATYHASQTINGCEGISRLAVNVVISASTPAPSGSANQTFCSGANPTLASMNVSGTNLTWYDAPSGGNVLPLSTSLLNGTTYYASQTLTLCGESTSRLGVTVTINTTPSAPAATASQSFCVSSNPTIASLSPSGASITWYNAPSLGASLAGAVSLVDGSTYYASQTVNGCESSDRAAVTVTVGTIPAISVTSSQTVCNNTAVALTATGTFDSFSWSPATGLNTTSGASVTAQTTTGGTYIYTVTGTVSSTGCSASTTTTVVVLPSAPSINASPASVCVSGTSNLTISPAGAYGAGIVQWQIFSSTAYADIVGSTGESYTTDAISSNTDYRVQIYDGAGNLCATSTPYTLAVVNPGLPTATGNVRCSPGTLDLTGSVPSGSSLNWYSTGPAGVVTSNVGVGSLGTGTTFTTPSLTAPTTYYLGSSLGSCEIRVAVVANIASPSPILLTNPQVVCNNSAAAINILSNTGDYTNYTWSSSPGTDMYQDLAGTVAYSGQNLTTIYIKRTTVGNRTYTVSATNSVTGCASTASTTVYVQPGGITASAAETQLCLSGSTQLSLNPAVGYSVGSIQWQSSTNGTTFNNIPLATSPNYQTLTQSVTRYYRAVVIDGTGASCQTTPSLTINVVSPAVVSTTGASVCGAQPATISATASAGATLNWYSTASSTASIGSSNSLTTPIINATTSFFVEATQTSSSGNCPSGRTEVVINYVAPPVLTLTPGMTVCAGTVQTLAVTSTLGDYTSYVWSPVTDLFTDLACTVPYTGTSATTVYYKSSTANQVVYSVLATNAGAGSCRNSASVSVNNQLIPPPTVTANPNPVCEGESVALTGSLTFGGSVIASIGTGTTTLTGNTYPNPFNVFFWGNKEQFLIRASELTAAGLSAGNITGLSFTVPVSTISTLALSNFNIRIGATTTTAMTTSFLTGLTQVFSTPSYTPVVGQNSFTFTTPFVWDGSSNLVIETCFNNGSFITNTTAITYTATSFNSVVFSNQDNATVCSNTTGTTSLNRPNIRLNGTNFVDATNTYNWVWNPGAVSSNTTTVVPPVGANSYTVTSTDPVSGCTATNSIVVNVNPRPAAPTATNGSQTGAGVPTCSVSGSGGLYSWFLTPTGGTALPGETGSTLTSYVINATTTFYVSEFDGTCQSLRTPVTQTVIPADPVSISLSTAVQCSNQPVTLTAAQTGTNQTYTQFTWTATGGASSGITGSQTGNPITITPTVAGTYVYTVTAYDAVAMVSQIATVSVTVGISPTAAVTPSTATLCQNSSVNLFGSGLLNTGNSLALNGTTAYVSVPNSATLDLNSNITLEAWIRPASFTSLAGIISKYQISGQPSYFLRLHGTSPFSGIGFGANSGFVTPTGIMTANNWYYVAAIFNSAGGGQDSAKLLFINVPAGTATLYTGTTTTIASVTNELRIGSDFGSRFFNGNIDEVRIWRTPLKVDTLLAWYNSPITPSHPNYSSLSAYYNFDNVTGTAVPDLSGNGNNGTLTGGALANGPTTFIGGSALTYSWSPSAGLSSSSTAATIATPTTAGTSVYTVTVTAPNGCTATASSTLTVNPQPSAPTVVSNPDLCGYGVPQTVVTSGGGTIRWYLAATGGTPVQSSTATSLSGYSISATTTFYVSEFDGTCESQRTPVTVTVTPADPIAASASVLSLCQGASLTLTVSNTASTPTQNYTYSWTGSAGSGITSALTGSSVTPTTTGSGTITYTVIGTDGACSAQTTVSVTVTPAPSITSVTANPASLCQFTTTTLTALTGTTTAGVVANVGSPSTTTIGGSDGNPYRSGNGVGNQIRAQMLVRASELTAAGLTAGNITELSFDVSSSTGTIANFTISLGSTSVTALTTTYETTPVTQVYTIASYTPVAGINTHVFSTPFFWDGTSNILVNTCQTNSVTGTSTVNASTPAFAANTHSANSTTSCSNATGTAVTARPLMRFTGASSTAGPGTYTWQWSGGAAPGNVATVTATTSGITTYTVTATDPGSGCSTSSTVSVTVTPAPDAPTVVSNPSLCGFGIPGATVTSAGGTVNWYLTATGGTPIQSSGATSLTSYAISATTTFYVTEFDGSCESLRTPITVTVNPADPISISPASGTLCLGGTIALTASNSASTPVNNYTYAWTSSSTSGGLGSTTGASVNATPTAAGTYVYTVVGTDGSCFNRATVSVVVNSLPSITFASADQTLVCSGSAITLTALTGQPAGDFFSEGFESPSFAPAGWSTGGTGVTWARSTTYFAVGSAATQATYSASANGTLSMTSGISLVGLTNPRLRFKHICATENGFDYGRIEYSPNGGITWFGFPASAYAGSATLAPNVSPSIGFQANSYSDWSTQFSSSTSTYPAGPATSLWKDETINLAAYTSSTDFRVRFRLTSDPSVLYAGWSIDDIRVTYDATAGAGTYTWQWSGASTPGNIVTVNANASSNYVVTATDPATGCTATQSVTVTVINTASTPVAIASPNPICNASPVTLSLASTDPVMNYSWESSLNGTTWAPAGTGAFVVTPSISSNTYFRAVSTCGASVVNSAPVLVTVVAPSVTSVTPVSITRCGPGSVTATVTGVGSFDWYLGSSPTPVAVNSSSVTVNVSASSTLNVLAYIGGCTSANGVTSIPVTVTPAPAVTASANASTVCSGTSTTLTASSGNSDYTYSWTTNGTTSIGSGPSLSVSPTTQTTYTVVATDNTSGTYAGCGNTATVSVAVNTAPPAPVITPASSTICTVGGCQSLSIQGATASAQGNVIAGDNSSATTTNATGVSPFSSFYEGSRMQYLVLASELQSAGMVAGNITRLSWDVTTVGAFGQNGFTLKLKNSSITTMSAYESGMTTVFNATSNELPAATGWRNFNLATPFNWDGTSNIVVEVCHNNDPSGTCSACFGTSSTVRATVTAFTSVIGSYDDNTTTVTNFDPCSGVFDGTVTGSNVTSTTRPNIRFQAQTGSPISYSWSPGNTSGVSLNACPTASTVYTVTASLSNGCTATGTASVAVTPVIAPTITASGSTTICQGGSVTLDVGSGYDSYSWSTNGTNVVGTSQTLNASPSVTTTYTVTVTAGTCSATATQTVTVAPLTAPVISSSIGSSTFCSGETTTLSVPSAYSAYLWSPGGQTTSSIVVTTTGSYTVQVTSANGCTATTSINITVNPTPTISVSPSGNVDVCDDGTPVVFTATASSGASIAWNDDNGTTGASMTIDAITSLDLLFGGGTYEYIALASSPNGCTATASVTATVITCSSGTVAVDIKAFIEGYYMGGGIMQPVRVNQNVLNADPSETDEITIELYDGTTYAPVGTATTLLMADGTASATVTAAPGDYYIGVRHRGAVFTWSAVPVTLGATAGTPYDFTTSASQAFGDNMKELEPGIYGFYMGDLNQDEYIDASDYPSFDADNLNGLCCDYYNTDMNGDGYVDASDYPIFDVNNLNGVFSIHP